MESVERAWERKEYPPADTDENVSFVHQYGEDVLSMLDVPEGSLVVDMGWETAP